MTKKVITIKVTKILYGLFKKTKSYKVYIRTRNHSDLSLSKLIL